MSVINANSVGPDQTPRSAASDLGLDCLPMTRLWDTRHKWVKPVRRPAAHVSKLADWMVNSGDPDQTTSEGVVWLGLHCLSRPHDYPLVYLKEQMKW